ncbi:GGDEF domain-containing protein [bacterium]|nr:GGDEF domain-containing protein [bacterium]
MSNTIEIGQILNAVDSGSTIKTLAPVMKHVTSIISREEDSNSLLEIVKGDAAIAVNLLRAANNPQRYNDFVYDIDSAAKRVGDKALKNLILSTEFVENDTSTTESSLFYSMYHWIWERTLFNTSSARILAERLNKDGNLFQTIGLVLKIGVFFMLENFREQYLPVLERWHTEGGSLYQYEQDELGVDHTVVGQHLAKKWNIGDKFGDVIRYQYKSNEYKDENNWLSDSILMMKASDVFFTARRSNYMRDIYKIINNSFNIDRNELTNLLQRIALEADGFTYAITSGYSHVSAIDLLRSITTELSRETLSYDQMVRELETARKKAEILAAKLEEANIRLREAADTDPLTKIFNRRYFSEFLAWNFSRATRYKKLLGCIMIDIDHFKRINDTYGHLTGDRVLQGVAEILRLNLRDTDIIARYGGEEFIALLPESRYKAVAFTANKLQKAVKAEAFPINGKSIVITVSAGYCCYNGADESEITEPSKLVNMADANMYSAKRNGRDQIWPSFDPNSDES